MSEPRFHVFIERPRSAAAGAGAKLSRAISEHYGLPAADLEQRIAAGRFRVKGNVDRATADAFAGDLSELGAECSIVSAAAPPAAAAAPVTLKHPKLDMAELRPPRRSSAPAFHGTDDEGGLIALSGEMTLSMLDGGADISGSGDRPSAAMLSASFGPPPDAAPAPVVATRPARNSSQEVRPPARVEPTIPAAPAFGGGAADPFAPPDEGSKDTLALDVAPPRKPKASAIPPLTAPVQRASVDGNAGFSRNADARVELAREAATQPPPVPATPAWRSLARDRRARFVAGVVLSAILGFVPASLVASVRERSRFASIDAELVRRHAQIVDRTDWEAIDSVRVAFAERKRAERQSIAFTSLVLWAAIGGGLAWVWFRKLDWNRLLPP